MRRKAVAFLLLAALLPAACQPAKKPPATAEVTLAFAGDVMMDRGIRRVLLQGVDQFRDTREVFRSADIAFYNQESPVTIRGEKYPGPEKPFSFRIPADTLSNVRSCGFTICNIANNHAMDYGAAGMTDTVSNLDAAGILHVGAGVNLAKAEAPVIIVKKGVRVAFLAAGDTFPVCFYATPDRPGIAGIDTERIVKRIATVRKLADYVILSLHWGNEYIDLAEPFQPEQAHAFIDAGADLVIGHGPHVLQGVESYQGRAIFYSLGNFVFDQKKELPTRFTMIPLVTLRAALGTNGVTNLRADVRFRPYLKDFDYYYPRNPTEAEQKVLVSHILRISRHLNGKNQPILTNEGSNGFIPLKL